MYAVINARTMIPEINIKQAASVDILFEFVDTKIIHYSQTNANILVKITAIFMQ